MPLGTCQIDFGKAMESRQCARVLLQMLPMLEQTGERTACRDTLEMAVQAISNLQDKDSLDVRGQLYRQISRIEAQRGDFGAAERADTEARLASSVLASATSTYFPTAEVRGPSEPVPAPPQLQAVADSHDRSPAPLLQPNEKGRTE